MGGGPNPEGVLFLVFYKIYIYMINNIIYIIYKNNI